MNRVEEYIQKLKQQHDKAKVLEANYPKGKNKGQIYRSQKDHIVSSVKYYVEKLNDFGAGEILRWEVTHITEAGEIVSDRLYLDSSITINEIESYYKSKGIHVSNAHVRQIIKLGFHFL